MPKGNRYKSCRVTAGKQPLKNLTIAVTGHFGDQRSPQQIHQWIHANGAIVAHEISSNVTHLVCSKEHFKKNVAIGTAYCLLKLTTHYTDSQPLLASSKGSSAQNHQDRLLGLARGYLNERASHERA